MPFLNGHELRTVAVLGHRGFVGSSAVRLLRDRDIDPVLLDRLPTELEFTDGNPASTIGSWLKVHAAAHRSLRQAVEEIDCVVNCAGAAMPDSTDWRVLWRSNVLIPLVLAAVLEKSGGRLVHVSSASVQGRIQTLDETPKLAPLSPYALSKAIAEEQLRNTVLSEIGRLTIYRPTSVHGEHREQTMRLRRLAASQVAFQIGSGEQPLPLASIGNVGRAIVHLTQDESAAGLIVLHPDEGWTQGELLGTVSDRPVRKLPPSTGRLFSTAFEIGSRIPALSGRIRRVELMLKGQAISAQVLQQSGFEVQAENPFSDKKRLSVGLPKNKPGHEWG